MGVSVLLPAVNDDFSVLSSAVSEPFLELASEERLVGSWGIRASSPRGMTEPGPRISSFSTERETGKWRCDSLLPGDDLLRFLSCEVSFFEADFPLFAVLSVSSTILPSLAHVVCSEVGGLVFNLFCFEVLFIPTSVVEEGESVVLERDNASLIPGTVVDLLVCVPSRQSFR